MAQERDMVSQYLQLLYVVWTGQMTARWLAGALPRTSPLGGPWPLLLKMAAEMKDTGS